jgi:hypothetical protein
MLIASTIALAALGGPLIAFAPDRAGGISPAIKLVDWISPELLSGTLRQNDLISLWGTHPPRWPGAGGALLCSHAYFPRQCKVY